MLGPRLVGGSLLTALLVLNCGRSMDADSPSAADIEAVGGAGGDANECSGGAPAGGCNGVGGEHALEAYARLRPACNLSVRVNRRGEVVCIDYHIK
jgi:hypothetical protein